MQPNVEFLPLKPISPWRKIALGTWRSCGDPSIYGSLDIDASPIKRVMEEHAAEGIRITPTVVIAKAIAVAMQEFPIINSVIRFGRVYQRKTCDVFLQVSPDSKEDNLSGLVIRSCDQKKLADIASEIKERAKPIKDGDEPEFKKVKSLIDRLPGFLIGPLLRLIGFVSYDLNLWSPLFKTPRDGFGSVMVTSVGMMGIDNGFAPLVPYSRCPILISVGRITERAVVIDGKVEIKPMLTLGATIDHRLIDGKSASYMLRAFRKFLDNPS